MYYHISCYVLFSPNNSDKQSCNHEENDTVFRGSYLGMLDQDSILCSSSNESSRRFSTFSEFQVRSASFKFVTPRPEIISNYLQIKAVFRCPEKMAKLPHMTLVKSTTNSHLWINKYEKIVKKAELPEKPIDFTSSAVPN